MQTQQVDRVSLNARLQGGFSLAGITPDQRAGLRDQLFDGLLHHESPAVPDQNALLEELKDFVGAIGQQRPPRVDGNAAVRALEVAAQILDSIAVHQWDGRATGRVGALGLSPDQIIRDPRLIERDDVPRRRKAG
jgi:predicted dehydrogenase